MSDHRHYASLDFICSLVRSNVNGHCLARKEAEQIRKGIADAIGWTEEDLTRALAASFLAIHQSTPSGELRLHADPVPLPSERDLQDLWQRCYHDPNRPPADLPLDFAYAVLLTWGCVTMELENGNA